jgi:hypothetical protein
MNLKLVRKESPMNTKNSKNKGQINIAKENSTINSQQYNILLDKKEEKELNKN